MKEKGGEKDGLCKEEDDQEDDQEEIHEEDHEEEEVRPLKNQR